MPRRFSSTISCHLLALLPFLIFAQVGCGSGGSPSGPGGSGNTDPPPSSGSLTIPYYSQGASNYCWATSVHMATQAAQYDDSYSVSNIVGTMGVDETGILSLQFHLSPTLSGLIRSRTGVKPTRQTWDYVNVNQMKSYLWKEIGLNGRLVVLFNGVPVIQRGSRSASTLRSPP